MYTQLSAVNSDIIRTVFFQGEEKTRMLFLSLSFSQHTAVSYNSNQYNECVVDVIYFLSHERFYSM